jgi:signal peptidase I
MRPTRQSRAVPSDADQRVPSSRRVISRQVVRLFREVVSGAALLVALQVGLVQAYDVPTGSMERTIRTGDRLLADKVTLGPRTPHWIGIPFTDIGFHVRAFKLPGLRGVHRGDVVVVEVPVSERIPFVKRVVAVSGDVVEVRNKRLFVNGDAVPDPPCLIHGDATTYRPGAVNPGIPAGLGNRDNFGPYRVPEGMVFLMGDNRDNSMDSRFFGPVAADAIIGKARVVTFSIDSESPGLPFYKRFRFSRIGSLIS